MRYATEHKQQTRERILDAAATVFRRQGFCGGSVDDVMAEAGLTAGGFYAHFKSKDQLFAEALIRVLKQGRVVTGQDDESLEGPDRIRSIARKYLSSTHRELIDRGCPMPPLLAELPRQSDETRQAFQDILHSVAASLEPHLAQTGAAEPTEQAFAMLALLIGGVSLARGVADVKLSNRILAACRNLLETALNVPPTPARRRSSPRRVASQLRQKRPQPRRRSPRPQKGKERK